MPVTTTIQDIVAQGYSPAQAARVAGIVTAPAVPAPRTPAESNGHTFSRATDPTRAAATKEPAVSKARRGRPKGSGATPVSARAAKAARNKVNTEIREWAESAGITIGTHGRIPAAVIAQYEARDE